MVVGLGNPGPAYQDTRHNIGFQLIDRLAARLGIPLGAQRARCRVGLGQVEGKPVCLTQPQTYMNRSGPAVAALLRDLGVGSENLLVVVDDLDLPLGVIRIRPQGSSGGHRGLESIIQSLGTRAFARLRIGIGRPPRDLEPADYVLQPFLPQEIPVMEAALERAMEAVEWILRKEDLPGAMSRYNG